MASLAGWALRGGRLKPQSPYGHWNGIAFIAGPGLTGSRHPG